MAPLDPEEEARILEAVAYARQQKKPVLAEIARDFNVEYQKFRRRWLGKDSKFSRPGANKRLDNAQEAAVKKYLGTMQGMGASLQLTGTENAANHFLKKEQEAKLEDAMGDGEKEADPPTVSSNWPRRFIKRNEDLTTVVQKPLSSARAFAHDPQKVMQYFNNLRETMEKYHITPENLWNMDETGFSVGIGGKRNIVVTKNMAPKNHYIASESDRESLTVTECISDAGAVIAPMIVFKGENILAKMTRNDLPPGTLFNISKSGYVDDIITLQWAEYFNKRTLNHRREGVWRLLLVDGHGSHSTVSFIEYMLANQIIVVKMPPHLTHLLQPLDLKVFSPYKEFHRQAVNGAILIGIEHYDKTEFLNDLQSIRRKTFEETTIMSAWKAAGVIPWNPDLIIQKMMESTTLQLEPPTTPTRSAARQALETPTTVRTLQRTGNMISKMDRNDRELSPLLDKFIRGSIQSAYAADKLAEDYKRMRTRKEDSDSRRVGGGRHLIPGGPVTVGLCRTIDERLLNEEAEARTRREWRVMREDILKKKRAMPEGFWRKLRGGGVSYKNRMKRRCGTYDENELTEEDAA